MHIEVTDNQLMAIQVMIDHCSGAGEFDEVPLEHIENSRVLVAKISTALEKQG
jgi:hypothetical protein